MGAKTLLAYKTAMEKIDAPQLEKMIRDAGTNPAALALKIGRDKDYIRDFLIGRKKSLKADDLRKILEEVSPQPLVGRPREIPVERQTGGIHVVGAIQAGAWIETYLHEEDERQTIPIARDPRFPHATQYALRVVGDSMDLEAPEGSFVVCVNFGESGLSFRQGMLVHVERVQNLMSETTLKQIGNDNGQTVLLPRSSNPAYKPIYPGEADGIDTTVRGVVLSVYRPQVL